MEKHSFPLQEEATEHTPQHGFIFFELSYVRAAIFLSSVNEKGNKNGIFLRERCTTWTFPLPSLSAATRWRRPDDCRNYLQRLSPSKINLPKHWIFHVLICKLKRPFLFHIICTLRSIFQNETHFSGQNPSRCRTWCQIIQNWFSLMKGIGFVIKIQRYIFFFIIRICIKTLIPP